MASLLALHFSLYAACDDEDGILSPIDRGEEPDLFEARYEWVLEFFDERTPVGYATVQLAWEPEIDWAGEPYRVYARRSGGGSYVLAATVTACGADVCRYTDLDVAHGRSYDYYVVAVDERTGREFTRSDRVTVAVPARAEPTPPATPGAAALDGAVYLFWGSVSASRYAVYLDDGGELFILGETDGTGFLDERAENGSSYRYRVAAIDEHGHTSELTPQVVAVPRPDYHSEVVRAFEDDPARSGFRFVADDGAEPIVAGTDDAAQWRLETVDGALGIRPLGQTRITAGEFTTALACGPGSESDCVDVESAPGASAFGANPVAVEPGFTHVLRVVGADGRVHYGKVRIQGAGVGAAGDTVVVFDWAYQLIPDEPRLWRGR